MREDAASVDAETRVALLTAQKNERTEHLVYSRLAELEKVTQNKEILQHISEDELSHYHFWKHYTGQEVEPDRGKAAWYVFIARTLGLTFSIRLMERGEEQAQVTYSRLAVTIPRATDIVHDEDDHEHQLIAMIDEERLRYVGSIVLGLNDALVELTGALAGFTLAMQNVRLIGMAGLITGIAASLSMATSEYLSTKSEQTQQKPLKAALYTGVAYVFTVLLLILPFFLLSSYLLALGWTLLNAILIILVFTFYISVAKELSFKRRFLEMALISLSVAALSFVIGYLVRLFLNIEI